MIARFHRAVAASRVAAQPCLAANCSCPRRVAKTPPGPTTRFARHVAASRAPLLRMRFLWTGYLSARHDFCHLKSYTQDHIAQGCKLNWINAGCGDFSVSLPLFVSYRDDGSTFVLADWNRNSTKSQRITVPIMTLNQIVASSRSGLPELVKIDAEGFDLKVLAGASDLLGKTDIFLVEAAVGPRAYDNSVAEVVRFMAKAGYNLMDITDLNRSPKHGVLWLCELAFLREGSPLLDAATSYE